MASLLTAIGAGLVVGQGRRIEAAEEAQEKADAIRAQKLMEFDFAKQLQDSKIQAEMKMKEMELSKEKTFDMDSWINAAKSAGVSDEGIKTGGAIISQGGKPDQTLKFLTSQDYREEQKAAEKQEKFATSTKDAFGEDIKSPEIKPTELSPYTVGIQLNKNVGTVLNPIANNYRKVVLDEFKTDTGYNKYANPVIEQLTADATKIDNTLNARTYDLTKEDDKKRLEADTNKIKDLILKYDSGQVSGVDPQDLLTILEKRDPATASKFKQIARSIPNPSQSSNGGGAPAPINQSGGGEVQGNVMPNEVKPQSSNYKSPADVKAALDAKQIDPNTARSILQTKFGFK